MRQVILEESDSDHAASMARFFERHLVDLCVSQPFAFNSSLALYQAADAVILSAGSNVSKSAEYLSETQKSLTCPIVVIGERPFTEIEELHLFESGAADCISPPFELRELLARLRARARRVSITRSRGRSHNYRFDRFALNCETRELFTSTSLTRLPKKECSLLRHFLINNHACISREELLDVVNREKLDVNDRSIDSLVSRLRDRLVGQGASTRLIRTIRGFGYMLDTSVDAVFAEDDLRAFL
jgi:DNA-binding response OmpR family regulator